MRRRWLGLFVLLAACGGGGAHVGGDMAGTTVDMVAASVYPAGPYGNKVGSVIPPLEWIGYADPLADSLAGDKPYAPYTMDDLRRSGAPFAAVHVSEFA